jgi:hypothetical protein
MQQGSGTEEAWLALPRRENLPGLHPTVAVRRIVAMKAPHWLRVLTQIVGEHALEKEEKI